MPMLFPGAHIALIAPSSPVYEKEKRDAAVKALDEMGYRVTVYPSVTAQCGYLSGADAVRAQDVEQAFCDEAVDGVVCLRGGYGAARLLPLIHFDRIKKHPKVFVGYSDTTALHLAIHHRCGFPTFHGPLGAELSSLSPVEKELWQSMLTGAGDCCVQNPDGTPMAGRGAEPVTGILIGGNMTVLMSLLGTPYMPDLAGKLLLLEDVGEKPYRIDGMLTQLKNAGVLASLKGLVLGDFTDCEPIDPSRSLSVQEVFEALLPKELPVLYGAHIGHGKDKLTLPLGIPYRLDAAAGRLWRLEMI